MLCNCDDQESSFWQYFAMNFETLGLKGLITTHYVRDGQSYAIKYDPEHAEGVEPIDRSKTIELTGDGDFRSPECVAFLEQADIVVTNPPFSLFREYVAQLVEHDKKFLIVGHQNAITYKEVFRLIQQNRIWLGYGFKGGAGFFINRHYENYATASSKKEGMIRVSGVHWFTNLDHKKRHEPLILYRTYQGSEGDYPRYDNFDAIEVSKTKDIPADYGGFMGVPITFMDKWNPDQFEIIGSFNAGAHGRELGATETDIVLNGKIARWNGPVVGTRPLYKRIIIRKIP